MTDLKSFALLYGVGQQRLQEMMMEATTIVKGDNVVATQDMTAQELFGEGEQIPRILKGTKGVITEVGRNDICVLFVGEEDDWYFDPDVAE